MKEEKKYYIYKSGFCELSVLNRIVDLSYFDGYVMVRNEAEAHTIEKRLIEVKTIRFTFAEGLFACR